MTTIALTLWENRISPVFDAAHDLLFAKIEGSQVVDQHCLSFDPDKVASLIVTLRDHEVKILICGAISEFPATLITDSGIRLIPFISGNVDQVLHLFASGESIVPGFLMPGCGKRKPGQCQGRGRCRRRMDNKDSDVLK